MQDKKQEIKNDEIDGALNRLKEKIFFRLGQKGRGRFSSRHETYGLLAEEFNELLDALTKNDNENFNQELLDIAVGCIIGMVSTK